jgi:hypothetical protein
MVNAAISYEIHVGLIKSRRPPFQPAFRISCTMCVCVSVRADEKNSPPADCGLNALFILLEMNGEHIDLAELRQHLTAQSNREYDNKGGHFLR